MQAIFAATGGVLKLLVEFFRVKGGQEAGDGHTDCGVFGQQLSGSVEESKGAFFGADAGEVADVEFVIRIACRCSGECGRRLNCERNDVEFRVGQVQQVTHVFAVVAAVCEEQVNVAAVFGDLLNGGGLPGFGQVFQEDVISLQQAGQLSVPVSAEFRDDAGDQGVAEDDDIRTELVCEAGDEGFDFAALWSGGASEEIDGERSELSG